MTDRPQPDDPLGAIVPPAKQDLLSWLRERLVAGMLIALPVVATFVILEFLINLIDSRVVPLIPAALRPETYLDYAVPGFPDSRLAAVPCQIADARVAGGVLARRAGIHARPSIVPK